MQGQVVVQLDGDRAAWWEMNHPKAENGRQEERGNRHTSSRAFPNEKSSSPLPAGITQKMIDQLSSLRRNGDASADSNLGAVYKKASGGYS